MTTEEFCDADKANYDSEVIWARQFSHIEDDRIVDELLEEKLYQDSEWDKLKTLEEMGN